MDQGKTFETKGSFGVSQNIILLLIFWWLAVAVGHLSQAFKKEEPVL